MKRNIFSSQTYMADTEDLAYEILEFQNEGGLIIQHGIGITVEELIADEVNEGMAQFTFTTEFPVYGDAGTAKLFIKDLQSDVTIVNVGCSGGNGGSGGDGKPGLPVMPGSKSGNGGAGGSGGNGGDGGDGGDAPTLYIDYRSSNNSKITIVMKQADGGLGGTGGKGANGGRNADGTLAQKGADGIDGIDGQKGSHGSIIINGQKQETQEGHYE